MRRLALLMAVAGLLLAADSPRSGSNRLVGRWLGGVWTCNGRWDFVVNTKDPALTLDVTGDSIELRIRCNGRKERWTYTLDPNTNTIDLTNAEGETQLGIYEIREYAHASTKGAKASYRRLRFCFARPGVERPERFGGDSSSGTEYYEFAIDPQGK